MEFPTDLDELVDLITSGQLDNDSIIRLVNIHKHMTGDCEQCLMIYDGETSVTSGNVINLVFDTYKSSLSQEAYNLILESMTLTLDFLDGGYLEMVMLEIETHPLASRETLESAAYTYASEQRIEYSEGGEVDNEDEVRGQLKVVAEHPRVTEEIMRTWLSEIHNFRTVVGHEGTVDACEICQGHFNAVWGS